ncbi:TIGR03986 family CRISPR-associated RAMP protein [Thermodesulfovibrio sp. 3462-1]|uniref:TIGR03986 family CRISPR-associated RAMP protein n=1 Tax=Thermodesulfovibrio obliviosus TaxID=3118332 RepID=A0AAU8H5S4_9BACT
MEKAKLQITKTKKGEFEARLIFQNNKSMPVSGFRPKDNTLDGKEVEVQRENGQVVKILCEGKEIYTKRSSSPQRDLQTRHSQRNPRPASNDIYARAPYNFIPLNHKVVHVDNPPDFDRYHTDRFTGYIDLEIKTLTPFYIRDTLTEDEYKEKIRIEKEKDQQYINPDFFSPGGLLRIPGSSLRGMIRTMVEIMSYGKFGFFEDSRLYYRGLADKCKNLRQEYQRKMSSFDKNSKKTQYKMSAGILTKKGFDYFITPAKGFRQILKSEARQMIEQTGKRYEDFKFYKVNNGYIVVSGPMENKKRDWFIEYPDKDAKAFKIPEIDIQNYKDDKNRSDKVPDLLKLAKDGVPCFYVRYKDTKGEDRISFGHTGMFRLAYEKTIGDHVPAELKKAVLDIPEAIFGNEKTYASRVFFEDAYLEGNPEDAIMPSVIPQILSGPKPTSFQHYLEQRPENLKDHPKNLAHYNSANPIRGYKLYWHRDGNGWEEVEISYDEKEFNELLKKHLIRKEDFQPYILEEKNKKIKINLTNLPDNLRNIIYQSIGIYETQHTILTPIKPGSIFQGRIRFENLSRVELGALLFALSLPDGLAHKLGMGKPLGLGSVEIKPRLYLSNRQNRYQDLFSEWNGLDDKTSEIEGFKKAFEEYVFEKLQENRSSLWETDRLRQLKKMLDFAHRPANKKTEYMELGEFRQRKVLNKPEEIL